VSTLSTERNLYSQKHSAEPEPLTFVKLDAYSIFDIRIFA